MRVEVIRCQGGVDLLVDEGVQADVRLSAHTSLAHRCEVLLQETAHFPCDEEKDCVLDMTSTVKGYSCYPNR